MPRPVFTARIVKQGKGLIIWIPKNVREAYRLKPGTLVKVVLEPITPPRGDQ